jgi:hypothetical protein
MPMRQQLGGFILLIWIRFYPRGRVQACARGHRAQILCPRGQISTLILTREIKHLILPELLIDVFRPKGYDRPRVTSLKMS